MMEMEWESERVGERRKKGGLSIPDLIRDLRMRIIRSTRFQNCIFSR